MCYCSWIVCGWSLLFVIQRMDRCKKDGNGECKRPHVAGQAVHALNNTAFQFATHSSIVEAVDLPVAAAFGFMPGLMLGLRKR